MPRLLTFLILLLTIAGGGCGLSDYEQRMDERRKDLKLLDEEDRALADPLVLPLTKGPDGNVRPLLPANVFLRPPRWISPVPKDAFYAYKSVVLCRYPEATPPAVAPGQPPPPPAYGLFLTAHPIAEKKEDEKEGKLLPQDFKQQVLGALGDFYRREVRHNYALPTLDAPHKQHQLEAVPLRGVREKVAFDEYNFADAKDPLNARHFLFLAQRGWTQVALVFQVPVAEETGPKVTTDIPASLKTLAVDGAAQARLSDYQQRKKAK